jgi:NAD-dependent DNA ligase
MPSEKLTRILRSKSPFCEQEISQMAEKDGWQWVYKNKKPKNGKHCEICFTGFSESEKSDLLKLATEAELVVVGSVTRNLSFLCKGQNPGPAKIEKATNQGVLIVTLGQLKQILQSGELPERG